MTPNTPRPTVLIVDDSITVRMDLKGVFENAGFQAELCPSLTDARAKLAAGGFDLLILDVQLPDGDGIEFLRELRAVAGTRDLPAMLLSTESEIQHRIRGLSIGANDFVGKPYEPAYVISRARELVARPKPRTGPAQAAVLVIDDSVSVREALREALEGAGYYVILAETGEQGIQQAVSRLPAAAIVDSSLPGIDGATVIRRLRSEPATRHLPCIMLTGSSDDPGELVALDAGADSYLRKGEELSVILGRLASLIGTGHDVADGTGIGSLFGPKKLLVLSDGDPTFDKFSKGLRKEQYEIVVARTESELSEFLSLRRVDAILLLQSGSASIELCRRIKSDPKSARTPLIVLGAPEEAKGGVELLNAGADDFMSRTQDHGVTAARLRAQIRRKQFEREEQLARDLRHRLEIETMEARANRELAELRATLLSKLEASNWELECFNSSVSHDLRAPLRSILGFSRILLEEHAAKLGPDLQDPLRRICEAAERMSQLIEDLLKLARINSQEICHEPVDLSSIARSVLGGLQDSFPDRAVEALVQADVVASGDRQLLRIVLENLLGNAWKYSSKNPSAKIEFGASEQDGARVYFVRDNGVGFDMKDASQLFGVFKRLHGETEFPGTGIGLVTVQRIVRKHGGKVWAEAATGRGATFRFVLA